MAKDQAQQSEKQTSDIVAKSTETTEKTIGSRNNT